MPIPILILKIEANRLMITVNKILCVKVRCPIVSLIIVDTGCIALPNKDLGWSISGNSPPKTAPTIKYKGLISNPILLLR